MTLSRSSSRSQPGPAVEGAGAEKRWCGVRRHGRLGTGTDFSEMFPMDFRHLGTGEAIYDTDTMVSKAMKRNWAQTACFDEMFSLLSKDNWNYSGKKRCCAQNGNSQGEQFSRKLCLCPKMMEMEKIYCI
jgi:hypothetical protein